MKHLIAKLSAFLVMLMCMSATVQAEIVHHEKCQPTLSSRGFSHQCWEDTETQKFYFNEECTLEMEDKLLAQGVYYQRLPESPIIATSEFSQSDIENDWSVDLNWAGVTSYTNDSSPAPRWVEFKASTTQTSHKVANVRLVWNKNCGDPRNGLYRVNIYVNDVVKYSRPQGASDYLEGVFVVPLLNLKKDDIVRFEVTKTGYGSWGGATFKACLEYNVVPCTHEYAAGSAVCSMCGYVKAHDHTYPETETCSQCGAIDPTYTVMSGHVGKENAEDIKWVFNKYNALIFTGTGEMEQYNEAHNAWRSNSSIDVYKIVVGEGITKIGDGDDNGDGYFSSQWSLREVVLPSTLKTIGSLAFKSSPLASINLPEGLETIGYQAFYSSYLPSVVIPESVTTIGQDAFFTNQLRSVTLKGSPTIGSRAFGDMEESYDFYLMSAKPVSANADIFNTTYLSRGTLHVNNDLYDWAKSNIPWKNFGKIVPLNAFNIEYTEANNNNSGKYFDKEAADNTWTVTDGAFKKLTINEDIPMKTLTYTRNFSTANQWQALYVPFEMKPSDWAGKFDVAAINNFHEYTNENGETDKIELEVRYVKSGKLLPNIPYLIRAKEAGEQSIVLNNVTLKATEARGISCSSTERRYTFTGTYDAIDGLQTKDYIFISGGRLCKANNDTDVLKPMRWYLTIEDYFSVTGNPAPALAKPMNINVIGEGETSGIEDITIVSSPLNAKASGIYSITGAKLSKPQQGINIINGKKIVIK